MLFLVCGVLAAAMFVGCKLGDLVPRGMMARVGLCAGGVLLLVVYGVLLVR